MGPAISSCPRCDRGACSFAAVLAEAQRLGYAEADPTFDIEGIDAAHKLTILAAIAFGVPINFDAAYTEGIAHLSSDRHQVRRATRLSHQAARHRQAHVQGNRTARASDAGADAAPDRERRRRDERRAGQGRRRRHHAVLRPGCGLPSRLRRRWLPTWSTSRACTRPIRRTTCRIWPSSRTRWQQCRG